MNKESILIRINNKRDLEKYEKIGINNFLFAVEDFSIGYNAFNLDELLELNKTYNIFISMNRIFNTFDIENIKKLKDKFSKFKYIFFEDIAIYNIFKDTNVNLIMNSNHFLTSINIINFWTSLVYSTTISNELTKEEVKYILDNANKPLILNVFGLNNIMYSRRKLLSNFNTKFNLDKRNKIILNEGVSKQSFLVKETEYGTIFFNNKYYNIIPYIENFNKDNILYYLIDTDLDYNELIKLDNSSFDDGFMNKKTIYKIGDIK